MNPVLLKEIAEKFTSKNYPQFLPRVERIWKMLIQTDFERKSDDKTPQHIGNSLAFADEIDPEFQGMITGVAVFAFTYQQSKNEEDISETELHNRITATCINQKISSNVQTKLESVLKEMMPSFVGKINLKGNREGKSYEVYFSENDGIETVNNSVSGKELRTKYINNRKRYDIFVHHLTVEKKVKIQSDGSEEEIFIPLELGINRFNLLVLFLKYKDTHLPTTKLYNKAWRKDIEVKPNQILPYEEMNSLKTAVSVLRKKFKEIGFDIPPASGGGYICKGKFSFCLILDRNDDQWYTI